jgi:hypothetical protein
MIPAYLYLYILGSSSFLPKITKTITLPTLGLPPMNECCSSSSCFFLVHDFLHACVLFFLQMLLPFLHAFFPTTILLSTSAWCQHRSWKDGEEFRKTERGFYSKQANIKKPPPEFTQLSHIVILEDPYRPHFS